MEILLFKDLLLITNFSILAYVLLLVIHHYQSNYDKKSWAFLFHILTFLWLLLRGVFWISTLTSFMKWSSTTFFVLYWVPTPLEFGAYMLLPLYFAQILYPEEWKDYWPYVRPVYFVFTIGVFLIQSIWSFYISAPKVKVLYFFFFVD
jgi:hypothetical protein